MPSDVYVALSGLMAMEARLDTVANNIANMRTGGFRAEAVDFSTVLSDYGRDRVAFAESGGTFFDLSAGPVEETGNPLDVAIVGEGWFGIETPAGLAYTRDGRFTVTPEGDLTTMTGYGVVDEGGAPIAIDLAAGPVVIGADGRMSQAGRNVGVLGLFALGPEAGLKRYGDTALLVNVPGEPVVDRAANGVKQGFREGSNVNAIEFITEMIAIQRAFEYGNAVLNDRQQSMEQAVRVLGGD
ncbi:flagellar basal-body rod protein FlgF [Acuticoccus mangrovi]|uniref:Flagellar basal-body rod protein FlgF n=1 Tax=Acuticoccus mangrovi TaxID=2796142 RepID=A0A934IL68_9HYPH|nr:flagellar basal-body rod protein FlgF [Acuticoccus mangrovi]MBJ3778669.1 flagellar basal-body rod protein FlgF [Acuticoccus mangrovi]